MARVIKGRDVEVGQIIKSGNHWYRIITITDRGDKFHLDAFVSAMSGQMHPLLVGRADDYLMRVAGA